MVLNSAAVLAYLCTRDVPDVCNLGRYEGIKLYRDLRLSTAIIVYVEILQAYHSLTSLCP